MDSDAESSSYTGSESCVEVEDFSPPESPHFDQNDDSAGPMPYQSEPLDPHVHTLECEDEPDEALIERYTRFCSIMCGKCEAMVTAEESQCCRELDAFWVLVENVNPTLAVQRLTLHPGFEACCLNPYVLQTASKHMQVVRWAYSILSRHIRKTLPAWVVSAIIRQFPEEGGLYKGFVWPHFGDNQ
uniref:Uncharacterized protein n=1 Tax=Cyprinus carpio carpio TaxID=630221 RepID=A0A9J7ZJB3_CYPCA